MIYVIGERRSGVVKIGLSDNPTARLADLQTAHPRPLQLLMTLPGGWRDEQALHDAFADRRLSGEWFDFGEANALSAVIEATADEPLPEVSRPTPARRHRSDGGGRRSPRRADWRDPAATLAAVVEAFDASSADQITTHELVEHLTAHGDPLWRRLNHKAATMALAWDLTRSGVERASIKVCVGGRWLNGYRRADIDTARCVNRENGPQVGRSVSDPGHARTPPGYA